MTRALYLFRNIRTKQVLASTENSLLTKPKLVKAQIHDPTLRPTVIRPDHWTPLVVASGFETEKAQHDAFTLISQPGHPLVPKTKEEIRDYQLTKNKHKRLIDLDTTERQIAQLARTLVYMDGAKSGSIPHGSKIQLYWENKEWISKVEEAGLQWPQWVEHRDLELKRGNIIVNPELRGGAEAEAISSTASN
ncbi:hypothetical protein GGI07_003727 [Coemansia sp. Benny D115]|nr:hypothetical protein GGI07_003727 [Coemansia sp. Benny D115]